jgi:hypothetical protein
MLAELTQLGQLLAREWQLVTHGDRLITGRDRLDTDAFLQTSKKMLAFSRLDPAAQRELDERRAAGADADEIKCRLGREAERYAGQAFERQVAVWRERAAKAAEHLPPAASGEEIMEQARAEVKAAEGH